MERTDGIQEGGSYNLALLSQLSLVSLTLELLHHLTEFGWIIKRSGQLWLLVLQLGTNPWVTEYLLSQGFWVCSLWTL